MTRIQLRWWIPVAVIALLLPSLGAAYHSVVAARIGQSHVGAGFVRLAATVIASPILASPSSWQSGRPCQACAERTPGRSASWRALPPIRNSGRLPPPVVLRPHAIGALFGVGSYMTERSPWLTSTLVRRVQLLGAGWVREEFTASLLHAGPNALYQWKPFDRVVDRERAAGLQVLGLLDYSDTWRYRTHTTMPHGGMSRLSTDFARYASTVVRHFRGRVSHWEVWNEPNVSRFWQPRPDPGDYAQLLARTYRAVKRVQPGATVMVGGVSGVDLHFLRAVADRTHAFDAIAVHPYRVVPETHLLRQIAALRAFHRPVWFTEVGWPAGNRCPLCTDEDTQAGDLVRFYTLAAGAGIRHIFWYDLRDDLYGSRNPEGHFGLLHRDLAGKPAFAAYRFLVRALTGARFVAADSLDRAGVYTLRFRSAGRTVVVLWNTRPIDRRVSLPWIAPSAALLSLDGTILSTPVPSRGTVSILLSATSGPLYLAGSPLRPVSLPGPLLRPVHRLMVAGRRGMRRARVVRRGPGRLPMRRARRDVKPERKRSAAPVLKRRRQVARPRTARVTPTPRSTSGVRYLPPTLSPTTGSDARAATSPTPEVTAATTPTPGSEHEDPTPTATVTGTPGDTF